MGRRKGEETEKWLTLEFLGDGGVENSRKLGDILIISVRLDIQRHRFSKIIFVENVILNFLTDSKFLRADELATDRRLAAMTYNIVGTIETLCEFSVLERF